MAHWGIPCTGKKGLTDKFRMISLLYQAEIQPTLQTMIPNPDTTPLTTHNLERAAVAKSGWGMLIFNLTILFGAWGFLVGAVMENTQALIIPFVILELLAIVLLIGHFTLQPNTARVLVLFGEYHGTVRQSGFHWANPFYSRIRGGASFAVTTNTKGPQEAATMAAAASFKVSLRARNLNTGTIKVNDKRGNPVEIGAVVVWRGERHGPSLLRCGRL